MKVGHSKTGAIYIRVCLSIRWTPFIPIHNLDKAKVVFKIKCI